MNAIQLLAVAATEHPELAVLPWQIRGDCALANLDDLGDTYLKPSPEHPGKQILVVVRPPEVLPLINRLHASGWKRGSTDFTGGPAWVLYAYLRRDGAEVKVAGLTLNREDGITNTAIPYFAPEPPSLSRKKSFLPEFREWERKCREDEW